MKLVSKKPPKALVQLVTLRVQNKFEKVAFLVIHPGGRWTDWSLSSAMISSYGYKNLKKHYFKIINIKKEQNISIIFQHTIPFKLIHVRKWVIQIYIPHTQTSAIWVLRKVIKWSKNHICIE